MRERKDVVSKILKNLLLCNKEIEIRWKTTEVGGKESSQLVKSRFLVRPNSGELNNAVDRKRYR